MGKQVKTPRFYVDMPTFLHATGQLEWAEGRGGAELLYMNCANPYLDVNEDNQPLFSIGSNRNVKAAFPVTFVGLLNHNFANENFFSDSKIKIKAKRNEGADYNITSDSDSQKNVLNFNGSKPEYNGSSIFTTWGTFNDYWKEFYIEYSSPDWELTHTNQLGSFVVGKYFDCPFSPDLKLTMSRSFDGIKKQRTIGGKTLANIYYDGPTEWTMNSLQNGTYKYPPFELDTPFDENYQDASNNYFNRRTKSGLGRKGLRSWNLSFSYVSESDMWIDNEVSNSLISDSEESSLTHGNPMLSDESFNFVWNCTLGGTLPFIFQPNNEDNNPDQFSICTFRSNTFSVRQSAPNMYSVSMTIDEVA
jgi:hypothetical protein